MSEPRPVDHPHGWRAQDLAPASWTVPLSGEAIAEVLEFARTNRDLDFAATGELGAEPRLAALRVARSAMDEARDRLENAAGFVVLDRLPVDELSVTEAKAAAWGLFSCLGRVVDQKLNGAKVYDVQDKQVPLRHGVRRSITNLEQEFHTDAGWLKAPPEVIGLFCYRPAEEGGLNQVLSLVTAHNELVRSDPPAAQRLFEPFFWDRQAEHGPEEPQAAAQPVFYREKGALNARYYDDYIHKGQALAGEALDGAGLAALASLRAVVSRPELRVEFGLEAGQYLLVHNRRIAHSRSAFRAAGEGPSRRHYFRLWSRREGSTALDG